MNKSILLLTLLLPLFLSWPTEADSQITGPIREIADPYLNDIARAVETPAGPVILYNPQKMAQVPPPVANFFREHELVHIEKLHGLRRLAEADSRPDGSEVIKRWEREADCLAAQRISRRDVRIIARWLESLWLPGDREHDSGFSRARNIRDCAGVVEDGRPIPSEHRNPAYNSGSERRLSPPPMIAPARPPTLRPDKPHLAATLSFQQQTSRISQPADGLQQVFSTWMVSGKLW